ncbi:flagellar filament capping protein FliD [Bacillus infantis]|uniref:flagellar filament capping protein FliD n=1 Tax=Bacillus infantis TaxID=324767 RepID=UPI00345016A2
MVRIGGLASGMDTDQLVADLMKAERMPLDKMKQKKQVMEWQRDDYRSMNTLLLNFRTELTQMKLSTSYRARSTSSTNDAKVTATATSAAALASYSISNVKRLASAATKVNTGALSADGKKIDASKSLSESSGSFAEAIEWNSGSVETKNITPTEAGKEFSLGLEGVKLAAGTTSSMNVKVNGKSYAVVTDLNQLNENNVYVDTENGKLTFKNSIAKSSSIKVDYIADKKIDTFSFTDDASSLTLSKGQPSSISSIVITNKDQQASSYKVVTDGENGLWTITDSSDKKVGSVDPATGKVMFDGINLKDASVKVEYQQNYFNFNVGSHTSKGYVSENFNIQSSESLNNVINKVNTSSAGVTMFYDSYTDKVTLTRTETGNFHGLESNPVDKDGKPITRTSADEEIVTSGKFIENVLKFSGAPEKGGDNAIFTINGLETERNSNTFDISGVTFTLKQTFSDTPVDIAISNNTNDIYENIKGFVDKYNELIGKIQGEISEEKYKSYTPLTDEQREQLSDKQQEQWEEKAKSGTLRRDPTLTSLLTQMRTDFYTSVNSEGINPLYKQLSAIGIKTTANYLEGGKLEINEAELKKAIEADPASIEKLFNASGTTNDQKGIVQRLYDTVNTSMEKVKLKAGNSFSTNQQFTMGKQLDSLNKSIDSFESRLTQVENRYWSQFTAMEKAIQRSNEQMAYLMQQFGG